MTKLKRKYFNELMDIIDLMSDDELIEMNNDYSSHCKCFDDYIYYIDELDDVLHGLTPIEIINISRYCSSNDKYFIDGICGLESFNSLDDKIYISDIVHEMLDSGETFGCYHWKEMQDVIDRYLEECDDDE